jgi:hypothetical protein
MEREAIHREAASFGLLRRRWLAASSSARVLEPARQYLWFSVGNTRDYGTDSSGFCR